MKKDSGPNNIETTRTRHGVSRAMCLPSFCLLVCLLPIANTVDKGPAASGKRYESLKFSLKELELVSHVTWAFMIPTPEISDIFQEHSRESGLSKNLNCSSASALLLIAV